MRIWIKVGFQTVEKVIGALKTLAMSMHLDVSRMQSEALKVEHKNEVMAHSLRRDAAQLLRDADEIDAAAEEMRKAFNSGENP